MTTTKVLGIVDQVRTRDQAQSVISELLQNWGSDTAFSRIQDEAVFAKQTTEEIAIRSAGNLLNSFVLRKPEGFVETL